MLGPGFGEKSFEVAGGRGDQRPSPAFGLRIKYATRDAL